MPFDCPIWPPDWPELSEAVQNLMRSGQWGQYHASICAELQQRIATDFGAAEARLCCSGSAALEIALRVARIGPGDEVVLAGYDYPGNFRTIELVGARPVLLDVGPDTLAVDPDQLAAFSQKEESQSVRAVIVSHLYGRAADVERLRGICEDRGWILIEDACQVPGMEIRTADESSRRVGSIGQIGTLSFGGSKPLSAGAGGALLVNCPRLGARLGGLLDRPGDVFPLSPLQAAVLLPQLDRLAEINQMRRESVEFIQREVNPQLSGWSWLSTIESGVSPAYFKVAWLAQSSLHRDRLIAASKVERLPIGAGFRDSSRISTKRCARPVPMPRSQELGERLFVLDQRALILPPSRHHELGEALSRLSATAP